MRPAKREQSTAWELRTAWAGRREVRLTLSDRCMIRTVVGQVRRVAVTGAFAEIDGWHIPLDEVLGTGKPTIQDRDDYIAQMQRLRETEQLAEAT